VFHFPAIPIWELTNQVVLKLSAGALCQQQIPHQATVDLLLYDVTGRVVARYSQELSGDTHPVVFNDIAQGVYFCTMHTGDFNATERIVVLK